VPAWRPLAGLIRSLSAVVVCGVTHHSPAAGGFESLTGTDPFPQPGVEVLRMLADQLDYVIGVDSHRDRHAFAIVTAFGAIEIEQELAADPLGYRQALALAGRHAPGRRVWAIEGTGSYGAGLTRFLAEQGEQALEVERPSRSGSRGRLKTDRLDALRAARTLLSGERLARPRSGVERASLRALLSTRAGAVAAKRAGLCQLRSLLVVAPEPLRSKLRPLGRVALLRRCSNLRPRSGPEQGQLLALRACARRILTLQREADDLEHAISGEINRIAPSLLDQPGIGPITAAQLLISWSHHGRFPNEAAFARLAGTAPIPASSGRSSRHRLDRGGDRQLNRALHTIALHRSQHDPRTKQYLARRIAEGKGSREATRCLKRYLARNLYRQLETMQPTT
jgi:transposase